MILHEFRDKMDWLAKMGIYTHSTKMLQSYFPAESAGNLKKTIERAISKGILERPCRGVYLSCKNQHNNSYKLESIAVALRSGDYSYISLETALSEFSIISQMTLNYLTVMTTGRSQTYHTPYGTIEFTHTERDELEIVDSIFRQEDRPLRIAKPMRALSDLKRVRRNLDLVNMETFKEVMRETDITD
jgi:hypothetical protein